MRDIIFTFFNYFVFFYTSMLAIFFVTFAFLSFISLKRRKDYYVESYMRKTIMSDPQQTAIEESASQTLDTLSAMIGCGATQQPVNKVPSNNIKIA